MLFVPTSRSDSPGSGLSQSSLKPNGSICDEHTTGNPRCPRILFPRRPLAHDHDCRAGEHVLAGHEKLAHAEQRAEAAEPFGTDARFLSAGKRLLDISHPAFKAVTAVRGKVIAFTKSMSLPYPEPGIRLIRQDKIDEFATKMHEFQEELAEAVENLDRHFTELKTTARQRLGSLYNSGDYPESLRNMFAIEFDFPRRTPPDYLQQLNPQLYEEECRRVQSRFDEAVRLAEQAFTEELAKLVSHLTERLSGTEDNAPRYFAIRPWRTSPSSFSGSASSTSVPASNSTAWSPTPSGSSVAWSPRRRATTRAYGSTSPRR